MKSVKKLTAVFLCVGLSLSSIFGVYASSLGSQSGQDSSGVVSDTPLSTTGQETVPSSYSVAGSSSGDSSVSQDSTGLSNLDDAGNIGPGFSSGSGSANSADTGTLDDNQSGTTGTTDTGTGSTISTTLSGDNLSNVDVGISPSVTEVDPMTGNVYAPIVHGQLLCSTGNFTEGFTSNMGAFNSPEEGFVGVKFRLEYSIGDIYYRVYRDGIGWGAWAINDTATPFSGESNKVTALQMRINGHTGNLYGLYYRVVLNDGSVLGWARDGQTSGTIGTGLYIQQVQTALYPVGQEFTESTNNYFYGANYEGLIEDAAGGIPTYSTCDGSAYTGWAYDSENNKYYFNQGTATIGWVYIDGYKYYFDETGKVVTNLEPIIGLTGDYILKLNKSMKTLTVYTRDGDNGYILPVKVILVTTGYDTPLGTYTTYASYRWKYMHGDIYCQFLLRFYNGFLLHSVIYTGSPSPYNLSANTYNQLGKNQSDGCVRMVAGDAAWVYTNCGVGTQLNIYWDDWTPGPFDKPAIQQAIPLTQNYDPTDPVVIAAQQAAAQ